MASAISVQLGAFQKSQCGSGLARQIKTFWNFSSGLTFNEPSQNPRKRRLDGVEVNPRGRTAHPKGFFR